MGVENWIQARILVNQEYAGFEKSKQIIRLIKSGTRRSGQELTLKKKNDLSVMKSEAEKC